MKHLLSERLTLRLGVTAALAISLTSLVFSMSGLGSAYDSGPDATKPGPSAGTSAGADDGAEGSIYIGPETPKGKSKKGKSKKGRSGSNVTAVDHHRVSTKPHPGDLLVLGPDGKFPASAIPTVADSEALEGKNLTYLTPSCKPSTVDLGTWCLEASAYPVPNEDIGKNNYAWASQACVAAGGWLPTAAQLIGAAKRVRLESTLTDDPATALVDEEPDTGLKDQREMSSTLVTTAAGSSAAGSEGVSETATGDPETGEPNPKPEPAVPFPQTLQYVTVYSNGTQGGFAGSEPVSDPQNFRCAYDPMPGAGQEEEE